MMEALISCRVCPAEITVEYEPTRTGPRILGYTVPSCNHAQTWPAMRTAVVEAEMERAPDPLRAETPAREAEPTGAATERAGARVTTCWCGDHAFPTGHHVLVCDSEAGRAKDAALRS